MKKIILLIIINLTGVLGFAQENLSTKYDLMPWPKDIKEHPNKFVIDSSLTISITSNQSERVEHAATQFLRRLTNRTGVFLNEGFPLENKKGDIQIQFDEVSKLDIKNNESYTLTVEDSTIKISAKTDIGATRALATLLQLVDHNATEYFIPGVTISDEPRFVWRGLMIDVSRHFQPIDVLKRNLDAMASMKMNVFHWHLTDDQGIRIESKTYPKLTALASDGLFYTHEQIKDVVAYADRLGIRVIPEIDVPGHATAFLTAYPELGSKDDYDYSIERFSGVFDPTLNPTIDITYTFLENLFAEITPLFPDEYFHIGGDENEGKHWDESKSIQKFKKKHGLKTNHDLQTYFNVKLEKILNKQGKKLMGWDEIMTPDMPTSAVIHSWRGENEGLAKGGTLIEAAKQGYQTVLSNGFYIDRMQSVAYHYTIEPIGDVKLTNAERERILGGEATMWCELATPLTIDSRIWPRTAAIAERFWSPKEINNVDNMRTRLEVVSFNLEELGLAHIKNRAVILRGMTNHQDISSLLSLSNLCEPLKIYARNLDGIEYKTYSPFNLFADACVADASDALKFNKAVSKFTKGGASTSVANYLQKWTNDYKAFSQLQKNPKITPLEPLFKNLALVSELLSEAIQTKKISKESIQTIGNTMILLREPVADVELMIVDALNDLSQYCESNYSSK
ncbi:family 20 glycosylhydrolase [Tamlana sp. 2_MG-2023]|uniref:beta-N-acetylhexosaminidase n=1 Tax=unclassified Tamlana TaxID=2614803 RepID=UPI0026E3B7D4|nr:MULTISPECIES: family 20 glycosylhydrolase [unclassified Tamlana]MDO6759286.1 family 20 glycosylhydrolase [Tamlana sp. 2_MG-2023]MDO6790575.1 family 20 glycosylhydrolase [Tamlana sp. 1_MG-2023]